MFRVLYPPIKRDFYTECLKNDELDSYWNVIGAIESISEQVGGYDIHRMKVYTMKAVDAGLMEPIYHPQHGDWFQFGFKLWSFFENKFKFVNECSDEEIEFTVAMVERFGDAN